jgi:flagellar motor switch/type III secretory pathway protein FliN
LDGTSHALFTGMENTLPDVEGTPEKISEANITAAPHQHLLLSPQKSVDAPAADPECTEMVPAFRSPADLEEDFAGTPSLPDHLRQIPFRVELRVPLSRFTVRDLQQLKPGVLLATEHLSVRDLVLTAAGERLLLVELEATEQQLAARVKRLAWRHKWRRRV